MIALALSFLPSDGQGFLQDPLTGEAVKISDWIFPIAIFCVIGPIPIAAGNAFLLKGVLRGLSASRRSFFTLWGLCYWKLYASVTLYIILTRVAEHSPLRDAQSLEHWLWVGASAVYTFAILRAVGSVSAARGLVGAGFAVGLIEVARIVFDVAPMT